MFLRHPLLSFVTLLYLAIVGWITLGPQPFDDSSDSLIWRLLGVFDRFPSTSWIEYSTLEFAGNVAMFLPIGLFFLLLFGRRLWWFAIVVSIALTIGIEFAQQFIPSRVSDPRDIVSNSVGALIGVFAGLTLTASKARQLRRANAAHRSTPTGPLRVR